MGFKVVSRPLAVGSSFAEGFDQAHEHGGDFLGLSQPADACCLVDVVDVDLGPQQVGCALRTGWWWAVPTLRKRLSCAARFQTSRSSKGI